MSKHRVLLVGLVLAVATVLVVLRPAAPLRTAWHQWKVVSMSGFASEPIPGASFRFVGDEIRLNDGANSMNFRIEWSREGFRVEEALISTDVGLPEGTSTFADLFEVGDFVGVDAAWDEVTLSRASMLAVAHR